MSVCSVQVGYIIQYIVYTVGPLLMDTPYIHVDRKKSKTSIIGPKCKISYFHNVF